MGQTYIDLVYYKEITFIVVAVAILALLVLPRSILGLYTLWRLKRGGLFMRYEPQPSSVVVLQTVYRENPEVFEEALRGLRSSLEKCASKYLIMCVIDAANDFPERNAELLAIAQKYGARVFMTNATSKRKNLRNAVAHLKETGEWNEYEFALLADSDSYATTPGDRIVAELLRPFSDPDIGGVTTAQRLTNVDTKLQRILDWLEDARIGSSMATGTLFGQVMCLPGRMYMIRSHVLTDWMDTLVNETWRVPKYSWRWPFVRFVNVHAHAGDDRRVTMRVQSLGYKTVMNPYATCVTTMPPTFREVCKVFIRWATSSQWLTIISLKHLWFWQRPFQVYQGLGDILITLLATYLPLRMLYLFFFGDRMLLIPLTQWLVISFFGILFAFGFRQSWHLVRHWRDIALLPRFILCISFWQYLRLIPWVNPGRVSVWGTRKGADETGKKEMFFIPASEWLTIIRDTGYTNREVRKGD